MNCRLIKLNIGGYKYWTTSTTLTKYPDTFFSSLLSETIPATKDEEGAYFIDRDGQFFSPILTWLRTNEISIPNTMTVEDVLREAIFYSIQPLVDILLEIIKPKSVEENNNKIPLHCPPEIERYVMDYWSRHEKTILSILHMLNKEGYLSITVQIIPGHRQDFERPPQLLSSGKLGLYMNFTSIHISKYTHVQCLLGNCFKNRGFSGYFRSGEQMELWWNSCIHNVKRENDILYF
jgi:hypothetical protein